jgi:hypothetical protein
MRQWARLSEAWCSYGVWRSLVARFVRDEEVAGSNPVTPTTLIFDRPEYRCLNLPQIERTCHELSAGEIAPY